MPKKKPLKGDPEVNEALKGFDIRIDAFGEITSNFEIERINKFLNENVEDKKLPEKEENEGGAPDSEGKEEKDEA